MNGDGSHKNFFFEFYTWTPNIKDPVPCIFNTFWFEISFVLILDFRIYRRVESTLPFWLFAAQDQV